MINNETKKFNSAINYLKNLIINDDNKLKFQDFILMPSAMSLAEKTAIAKRPHLTNEIYDVFKNSVGFENFETIARNFLFINNYDRIVEKLKSDSEGKKFHLDELFNGEVLVDVERGKNAESRYVNMDSKDKIVVVNSKTYKFVKDGEKYLKYLVLDETNRPKFSTPINSYYSEDIVLRCSKNNVDVLDKSIKDFIGNAESGYDRELLQICIDKDVNYFFKVKQGEFDRIYAIAKVGKYDYGVIDCAYIRKLPKIEKEYNFDEYLKVKSRHKEFLDEEEDYFKNIEIKDIVLNGMRIKKVHGSFDKLNEKYVEEFKFGNQRNHIIYTDEWFKHFVNTVINNEFPVKTLENGETCHFVRIPLFNNMNDSDIETLNNIKAIEITFPPNTEFIEIHKIIDILKTHDINKIKNLSDTNLIEQIDNIIYSNAHLKTFVSIAENCFNNDKKNECIERTKQIRDFNKLSPEAKMDLISDLLYSNLNYYFNNGTFNFVNSNTHNKLMGLISHVNCDYESGKLEGFKKFVNDKYNKKYDDYLKHDLDLIEKKCVEEVEKIDVKINAVKSDRKQKAVYRDLNNKKSLIRPEYNKEKKIIKSKTFESKVKVINEELQNFDVFKENMINSSKVEVLAYLSMLKIYANVIYNGLNYDIYGATILNHKIHNVNINNFDNLNLSFANSLTSEQLDGLNVLYALRNAVVHNNFELKIMPENLGHTKLIMGTKNNDKENNASLEFNVNRLLLFLDQNLFVQYFAYNGEQGFKLNESYSKKIKHVNDVIEKDNKEIGTRIEDDYWAVQNVWQQMDFNDSLDEATKMNLETNGKLKREMAKRNGRHNVDTKHLKNKHLKYEYRKAMEEGRELK